MRFNTYAERSSGRSPRLRTYRISRDSGWSRRTAVHRGRVFPLVRRPRSSGSTGRIVSDRRRTLVSGDIGIHRGWSVAVRAQGLHIIFYYYLYRIICRIGGVEGDAKSNFSTGIYI